MKETREILTKNFWTNLHLSRMVHGWVAGITSPLWEPLSQIKKDAWTPSRNSQELLFKLWLWPCESAYEHEMQTQFSSKKQKLFYYHSNLQNGLQSSSDWFQVTQVYIHRFKVVVFFRYQNNLVHPNFVPHVYNTLLKRRAFSQF